MSRDTVTLDGEGHVLSSDAIGVGSDGTTTHGVFDLDPNGSHVDGAVRTTSAGGLHVTTRISAAGYGYFNRTTDDTTADRALAHFTA